MNKPLPTRYCWDTSVFLAWLNREKTAPLDDIDALIEEVQGNKALLIVSVITYAEMLRAKHTATQARMFDDFLKRSSIIRVDVSFQIAQKAEEIRSRCITLFPKGQKRQIKTPDATIIATAIVQQAHVLHTLEPTHHHLSGHACVDQLRITPPRHISRQKTLNLTPTEDSD